MSETSFPLFLVGEALKLKDKSLFDTLKRLQSRILTLVLRRRMQQYRKGNAIVAHDIMETLTNHIEKLSVFSAEDPGGTEFRATWDIIQPSEDKISAHQEISEEEANLATGELAKHFNRNGTEKIMHPDLSDKLQNSTWEHIHTAIRLAHQGNKEKARLHADIANSALKEVAHYMGQEDYNRLINDINTELDKLHY